MRLDAGAQARKISKANQKLFFTREVSWAACPPTFWIPPTASPHSGVAIELFAIEGEQRRSIVRTTTNADGRTDAPLMIGDAFHTGTYELVFRDWGLFHIARDRDGRSAVSGYRADPLHHRRARRALSRSAPRFALELLHLSRKLTMPETSYPRDLVGYGRNPPHPRWPNEARICVQFVINYEEGGENNILHGDRASEAFLSEIVGAAALARASGT